MVINTVPLCDKVTSWPQHCVTQSILLGLVGEGIHHGGIVSDIQIM